MASETTVAGAASYDVTAVNVATSVDQPLEQGDRLDQPLFHERYKRMPSGFRAELIGGVVHVPSPLSLDHASGHGLVMIWLGHYVVATPGVKLLDAGTIIMGPRTEPQPDAALIIEPRSGGKVRYVESISRNSKERYVAGAPELVVEVASSSQAYDLHAKRDDYERSGVGEYAVVMVRDRAVRWFYRADDKFVDAAASPDGVYQSRVFPGLWLDPRALFADDSRGLVATLNRGLATPEHATFCGRLASVTG